MKPMFSQYWYCVSQHKSHLCTFVAFFTTKNSNFRTFGAFFSTKNSNFHTFVVKCQVAIRIYDLVKFSRIPGLEGEWVGVGGCGVLSQSWQCYDFESIGYISFSLTWV